MCLLYHYCLRLGRNQLAFYILFPFLTSFKEERMQSEQVNYIRLGKTQLHCKSFQHAHRFLLHGVEGFALHLFGII